MNEPTIRWSEDAIRPAKLLKGIDFTEATAYDENDCELAKLTRDERNGIISFVPLSAIGGTMKESRMITHDWDAAKDMAENLIHASIAGNVVGYRWRWPTYAGVDVCGGTDYKPIYDQCIGASEEIRDDGIVPALVHHRVPECGFYLFHKDGTGQTRMNELHDASDWQQAHADADRYLRMARGDWNDSFDVRTYFPSNVIKQASGTVKN